MTRSVSIEEIEGWVEPTTFHRGMEVADRGGVANRVRSGDRIAGEVEGHRAAVRLADPARASCSCRPKAPFCEHATAVLVDWARNPRTFRAGTVDRTARKRERTPEALDALERSLSELADSGLGTVTDERLAQLRELAIRLRDGGWTRLSSSVSELAASIGRDEKDSLRNCVRQLVDLVSLQRSAREGKTPAGSSEEILEVASVDALLLRYREWREDPSAPSDMPTRIRFAGWLSRSGRLHLVDSAGALLPLDCEDVPLRKLGPVLAGSEPAILARVRFDGESLVARPITGI